MSKAIEAGLYHPRRRDSHTTYFEGISTPPNDVYGDQEIEEISEAKRNYERYSGMEDYSLDAQNKRVYSARAKE